MAIFSRSTLTKKSLRQPKVDKAKELETLLSDTRSQLRPVNRGVSSQAVKHGREGGEVWSKHALKPVREEETPINKLKGSSIKRGTQKSEKASTIRGRDSRNSRRVPSTPQTATGTASRSTQYFQGDKSQRLSRRSNQRSSHHRSSHNGYSRHSTRGHEHHGGQPARQPDKQWEQPTTEQQQHPSKQEQTVEESSHHSQKDPLPQAITSTRSEDSSSHEPAPSSVQAPTQPPTLPLLQQRTTPPAQPTPQTSNLQPSSPQQSGHALSANQAHSSSSGTPQGNHQPLSHSPSTHSESPSSPSPLTHSQEHSPPSPSPSSSPSPSPSSPHSPHSPSSHPSSVKIQSPLGQNGHQTQKEQHQPHPPHTLTSSSSNQSPLTHHPQSHDPSSNAPSPETLKPSPPNGQHPPPSVSTPSTSTPHTPPLQTLSPSTSTPQTPPLQTLSPSTSTPQTPPSPTQHPTQTTIQMPMPHSPPIHSLLHSPSEAHSFPKIIPHPSSTSLHSEPKSTPQPFFSGPSPHLLIAPPAESPSPSSPQTNSNPTHSTPPLTTFQQKLIQIKQKQQNRPNITPPIKPKANPSSPGHASQSLLVTASTPSDSHSSPNTRLDLFSGRPQAQPTFQNIFKDLSYLTSHYLRNVSRPTLELPHSEYPRIEALSAFLAECSPPVMLVLFLNMLLTLLKARISVMIFALSGMTVLTPEIQAETTKIVTCVYDEKQRTTFQSSHCQLSSGQLLVQRFSSGLNAMLGEELANTNRSELKHHLRSNHTNLAEMVEAAASLASMESDGPLSFLISCFVILAQLWCMFLRQLEEAVFLQVFRSHLLRTIEEGLVSVKALKDKLTKLVLLPKGLTSRQMVEAKGVRMYVFDEIKSVEKNLNQQLKTFRAKGKEVGSLMWGQKMRALRIQVANAMTAFNKKEKQIVPTSHGKWFTCFVALTGLIEDLVSWLAALLLNFLTLKDQLEYEWLDKAFAEITAGIDRVCQQCIKKIWKQRLVVYFKEAWKVMKAVDQELGVLALQLREGTFKPSFLGYKHMNLTMGRVHTEWSHLLIEEAERAKGDLYRLWLAKIKQAHYSLTVRAVKVEMRLVYRQAVKHEEFEAVLARIESERTKFTQLVREATDEMEKDSRLAEFLDQCSGVNRDLIETANGFSKIYETEFLNQ